MQQEERPAPEEEVEEEHDHKGHARGGRCGHQLKETDDVEIEEVPVACSEKELEKAKEREQVDQAVQERLSEVQNVGGKEENQEPHGDPLHDPSGTGREAPRLALEAQDQDQSDENGLSRAQQFGQPESQEAVSHEEKGGKSEPLVEGHRGISYAGSATLSRPLPSLRGPERTAVPGPSQMVTLV